MASSSENNIYLAGLLDGEAVLHTKNTGIVSEKIDHENIFVGEYRWK